MLLGRDFSSRRAAVNIFAKHLYIKLLYINNDLSVISLEKTDSTLENIGGTP